MKVHSINCGTLCPVSARLTNGSGPWLERGRLVCHCWLVESPDGLVLVDTGVGLQDLERPAERLGRLFAGFVRPENLRETTAVGQVERLGFRREDVRHIIPTHLDLDHAGGLPDFPNAQVHVFRPELEAARARATVGERGRYRPVHWAHEPAWRPLDAGGDRWFGFESVRALGRTGDELLLVPLRGHTRGHCGVAVRTPGGWLLHAGDAYFFHGEITGAASMPAGLAFFERMVAFDGADMRRNRRRLHDLHRKHSPEISIHSAHCPVEFDRRVAEQPEPRRGAGEPPTGT